MADSTNKEPVYTAGLAGGGTIAAGYIVLQEPIRDILLELGASERLSKAIVNLVLIIMPIVVSLIASWWARKHTVPVRLANQQIQAAFDTPANAPRSVLEDLKIGKETT